MIRPRSPNRLLANLPKRDLLRLLDRCHRVELTAGEVLSKPGTRLLHAHFPLSGIVSAQIPFGQSASLQIEFAGAEGMIGLPLVFGVNVATLYREVQYSGAALRVTGADLRRELARSHALRRTLGRYACVLRAQLAESVGCNGYHPLEARMTRWLLSTLDRVHSNRLLITHQALGYLLGVRRESVTTAASALQKRKLLSYSRGEITVIDREGLEKAACACYTSAGRIYEQFLGTDRGAVKVPISAA